MEGCWYKKFAEVPAEEGSSQLGLARTLPNKQCSSALLYLRLLGQLLAKSL